MSLKLLVTEFVSKLLPKLLLSDLCGVKKFPATEFSILFYSLDLDSCHSWPHLILCSQRYQCLEEYLQIQNE